jgi:cyclopropane fatty-acyl-phospholipid synthase-like methyltransferase
MTTSPRFWNWMAKRYARQPVANEAAYRQKLETARSYLRPDMNVLEFGCGTGSTALLHAPHVKLC